MASQKLNIDIIARDKTKQALGGIRGALGRLKSSIFSVQSAFIGLGAGLVTRNLVNTGKDLENLRTRLKFLLKDTNEGAKAFDNMVKFASKVPFSLEEIQRGSGILATVTDNAEDLQNMLEITGNVAAVTGLDFRTTAEQIQRSFSAGIGAADLFREKGVRNMLGFKAGATVSIEETVQAFEKVFGKEGRFGKATDELAQTFEGTLSMIGDKVFNFKKVLLEAGFFEELKNQFGELDKFLEDNAKQLDEIATTVGKNLAQGMVAVVNIGKDLIPTIQKIGSGLKSIVDGFMTLPPFVQSVGLIGAFIFGKKGAAALAGVSFVIDKIDDFINRTKAEVGIFDTQNMEEVREQLNIINQQLENGSKEINKQIHLNNGVVIEQQELINLGQNELDLLRKRKAELETILILNGKGSENQFEINRAVKETIESTNDLHEAFLRTQQPIHDIIHDMSLIPQSVKDAREEFLKTQQPIQDIIHDMSIEMPSAFKKAKNEAFGGFKKGLTESLDVSTFERFKEAGQKSLRSLQSSISDFIMTGKLSFKTLKEAIIRSIVEAMVGSVVTSAIKRGTELFKFEAIREGLISAYKAGVKALASVPFPFNIAVAGAVVGAGMKFVDKIKGFEKGGAVSKGQPILVGERGPEMFVPNSTGQITQSARGTDRNRTILNFNISATDVRGVKELLVDNRATIVNVINSALNEKGREALV